MLLSNLTAFSITDNHIDCANALFSPKYHHPGGNHAFNCREYREEIS